MSLLFDKGLLLSWRMLCNELHNFSLLQCLVLLNLSLVPMTGLRLHLFEILEYIVCMCRCAKNGCSQCLNIFEMLIIFEMLDLTVDGHDSRSSFGMLNEDLHQILPFFVFLTCLYLPAGKKREQNSIAICYNTSLLKFLPYRQIGRAHV